MPKAIAVTNNTGEKGYWCYGDPNSNSNYEKFTMVSPTGEEEIVYCYNHELTQPISDKESAQLNCKYERYGFYDGMENLANNRGDQDKVNKVAAVLMVGYPNDGLGKAMDEFAYQSYLEFKKTYGSHRLPDYSFDDFKREMTQAAIWQIDNPSGRYISKSSYAKALYDYAQTYPLNQETAYATNIKVVDNSDTQISADNPLKIDPSTLKSQDFKLDGYDGVVGVDSLPSGYQLIDKDTNKEVSGLLPDHIYYIKADTISNETIELDATYMDMKDSYFYQPEDANPWQLQNMVNSKVTRESFKLPLLIENGNTTVDSSSESTSEETSTTVDSSSESTSEETSTTVDSSNESTSEETSTTVDSSSESTSEETSTTVGSSSESTSTEDSNSMETTETTVNNHVVVAYDNNQNNHSGGSNDSNSGQSLPKTGTNKMMSGLLFGLGIIVVGIVVFVLYKRKNK